MSEWITDRRPTADDADLIGLVWVTKDSRTQIAGYAEIENGQPWMSTNRPAPYVKPKRWEAVYDRYYKCWAIGDRAHVTQLARLALYSVCRCHLDDRADVTHLVHLVENNDEHREAAERIAAIYEEIMP